MTEKTTSNDRQAQDTRQKKAPYESPAWEVEETETEAAMACVKPDAFACPSGPIQS
jgi:hypothetical protein